MENKERYKILDTQTNSVIPIDVYVKHLDKETKQIWQKAYAEGLAAYLGIVGSSTNKVLAYIIQKKDPITNIISGTVREIAKILKVSPATVNRVFKSLVDADLLRKVRNGAYVLNADVIGPGSYARNIAVIQLWEESRNE